jgi:U6 snRNA-associated Sm-like protein LSm8
MSEQTGYFYAGVSSLAEQLDKPIMALMQDGRVLLGTLISFDHFGTLVLKDAKERQVGKTHYCDIEQPGIYVIRGENLCGLGEVDPAVDSNLPSLTLGTQEEVFAEQDELISEGKNIGLTNMPYLSEK